MASPTQRGSNLEAESEVWQAISAFEQILEVMPNDRSSLETLSHAYEHVGERARALDYLLRLSTVVLEEGDAETAAHLRERLAEYEGADERVGELRERLAGLRAAPVESGEGEDRPQRVVEEKSGRSTFRVSDELSFAWKLFEAGELSQEDYAAVAHDLAELSVDPHPSTVSVLHVLEARAYSGLERVIGYASRETKTPVISLQSFEVDPGVAAALTLEFMIRRGALVFAVLQDELLVALLNPYDWQLREDVIEQTGKSCHFFMAIPSEFDDVIALLRAAV